MEIRTTKEIGYIDSVQNNSITRSLQEPKVSLESCDTVSLSTSQKPKSTIKDVVMNFIQNMTAARPSALTYMRYGGLKFIEKEDCSHHKSRDKYHYMDFPEGTKVMTRQGVKEIKANQVAILGFDGNFYIANIKDILGDTSDIIKDTGSIGAFARKEAKAKEEARLKEHSRIDQELDDAGVRYIGRINKDNPEELKDNVVIEINGERKELCTILYTEDDYKYKNEILKLLKNGELKDDTILFY